MKDIRGNKYYKLVVIIVKLLSLAFIIYTVIQFFQTISESTLYIIIGIALSWRIWVGLFKLTWLLIQFSIFLGVIYLLII